VIDVGGGLAVPYRPTDPRPTVGEWAGALFGAAPSLREARLVTEIGRWMHAPTGAVVTRVEYTRDTPVGRLGVMHVGADLLLRAVYRPEDWWHEVEIRGPDGERVDRPLVPTMLCGPLCFGGDVVVRGRELPEVREGDLVVIRDTGAYTLAMWSRHCSRGVPALVGASGGDVELLRERERPEDVVRWWGSGARE
jgi:diaminopimelate decarboxylase